MKEMFVLMNYILCTSCMRVKLILMVFRYENSDWGWKDKEKREEMTEDKALYLIARDSFNNKPVAFTHFRFDMEFDEEVLYW